jgi:hypothetical protein
MADLVLDDQHRIRPEARVIEAFRCQRRRHLQGMVAFTTFGPLVVWRDAAVARTARDVWAQSWLDEMPDGIRVTCHCGVDRRVDLASHRRVR